MSSYSYSYRSSYGRRRKRRIEPQPIEIPKGGFKLFWFRVQAITELVVYFIKWGIYIFMMTWLVTSVLEFFPFYHMIKEAMIELPQEAKELQERCHHIEMINGRKTRYCPLCRMRFLYP